jgi:hypothetical protein
MKFNISKGLTGFTRNLPILGVIELTGVLGFVASTQPTSFEPEIYFQALKESAIPPKMTGCLTRFCKHHCQHVTIFTELNTIKLLLNWSE